MERHCGSVATILTGLAVRTVRLFYCGLRRRAMALIELSAARAVPGPCFGGTDRRVFGRPASCYGRMRGLSGPNGAFALAEPLVGEGVSVTAGAPAMFMPTAPRKPPPPVTINRLKP